MVPILELRGGFVAAALLKIPYLQAVPICIIGNIIPIPFILLFIKKDIRLDEKREKPLKEWWKSLKQNLSQKPILYGNMSF